MAKKLAAQTIKTVIDSLKEGPKNWKELMALRTDGKGIPEKSLSRILQDYLQAWGLVFQDKENGKWHWVLNKRVFKNKYEYDLAIEHSRQIFHGGRSEDPHWPLPTNVTILEMFAYRSETLTRAHTRHTIHAKTDGKVYAQEFFQHLKTGYPDLYSRFQEFAELFHKRGQLLKDNLSKDPEFEKTWGEKAKSEESINYNNFMGYQFPSFLKESHFDIVNEIEDKEACESYRQSKEKEWSQLTGPFSEQVLTSLIETDEELMMISEDAVGKLSGIDRRVEHGIPLEGYCDYCPHKNLTIGNEEQQASETSEDEREELQKRGTKVFIKPHRRQ